MNLQTTTTTPKERPILFSAPMVRAILEDRKTQTRRIAKPFNPPQFDAETIHRTDHCEFIGWSGGTPSLYFTKDYYPEGTGILCPYGRPGDRLWVRESFFFDGPYVAYRADHEGYAPKDTPWKPSIHMPRAASRILLEITDVRAERLQDISEEDAKAEGVQEGCFNGHYIDYLDKDYQFDNASESFKTLWQSINGPESWNENPFVFAITFKRLQP